MRIPRRALTAIAALPALPGCSPARLVTALSPSGGYSTERDIAFGEGPRDRLDLYRPDNAGPGTPLVVFFYGGGWSAGERAEFGFVGQALSTLPALVAIPDYRLFPGARWPDFLADGAAAVRFLRAGAGAGRPVFLIGHSAGAFIAAALATDPQWLGRAGRDSLAGFAGLAGPYDFRPDERKYVDIFAAAPDGRARAAPRDPATLRGAPPMLILHGLADDTVAPERSRELAREAAAAGVPATLREYPGVGHIGIVAALAAPVRGLGLSGAPVLEDLARFVAGPRGAA